MNVMGVQNVTMVGRTNTIGGRGAPRRRLVGPTNRVSERALRPAVLWRKGSFGSDSAAGSRFLERLLTVVATCRQQGRHLLDFLVAAGEAALHPAAAPSLLPAPRGGVTPSADIRNAAAL